MFLSIADPACVQVALVASGAAGTKCLELCFTYCIGS